MNRIESLVLVFTMLTYSLVASAAVIHVPADQPTIQAGIDAAVDGDTVLVADGTYTGEGNRDIDFLGKAITVKSENGAQTCIVDCKASVSDPHRGFHFQRNEFDAVLDGFTIFNGYATGEWPESSGGGILCTTSSPRIKNCIIMNNYAEGFGGGICCGVNPEYNMTPWIDSCTISHNSAGEGGGFFSTDEVEADISDSVIKSNYADSGGGASCYYAGLSIFNCIITENSAISGGGLAGDFLYLSNCRIFSNIAESFGGGVTCNAASIRDCIISNNTGGGFSGWGHPSIPTTLTNTLIYKNIIGSAIDSFTDGEIRLRNCIVVNNSCGSDGTAISTHATDLTLSNCIVWDNTTPEIDSTYGTVTVSFSCVQGGWEGHGNIDKNPLFSDPDSNDYHLTEYSPCIDAGTDENTTTNDFEGASRTQGGAVDMGVYEYPGWPSIPRVYVKMPSHLILPGDRVKCLATVWNPYDEALSDHRLFVVLDVFGQMFMAPSFSEFDSYPWSFGPGRTIVFVLPEFEWPDNVGFASDIVWYAFLTNMEMTELASEIGVFDFGWSE